jgi:quinoprotein dehydrogenase-associated probable ABC transporter substrate-binding protein
MCLACRSAVLVLVCVACGCSSAKPQAAAAPPAQPKRVIHVVADPNNLPFSNDKLEGFENRIAQLLAQQMNATVEYTWRAQRRGFFRHAFKDDGGDVVLGVPAGFDRALTTSPYYRSSYVFVWRKDRNLDIRSLNDPKLRELKIGVQVVGDDGADTPPAHALARRGIVDNVVGFTLYGDYTKDNPPARIMDAVVAGGVDVAVVWGPLAGFYARRGSVPLEIAPVLPPVDPPGMQFAFSIAMGVRKDDPTLRDELNAVLAQNRAAIDKILNDFGVPRVGPSPASTPPSTPVAKGG